MKKVHRRRRRTRRHPSGCARPLQIAVDPALEIYRLVDLEIARNGWSAFGVQPPAHSSRPDRTYTIGLLETFQHPELVVFGLVGEPALCALAGVVARFLRAGVPIPQNEVLESVFLDRAATVRPVHIALGVPYALIAQERANERGVSFSLAQLVWSDREGRFPWESGFERGSDPVQPRLYDRLAGRIIPIRQARAAARSVEASLPSPGKP